MSCRVIAVITASLNMSFSFTFFTQLIFPVSEVEWRNVKSLSSQMLRNIYIDELYNLLIESEYGCHTGNHYMSTICYLIQKNQSYPAIMLNVHTILL